jgi:hypothetical protein
MHADDLWHCDPEKAFSTVGTFIRTVKETAFAFKGHIFSSSHLNSGGTFMLSFSTGKRVGMSMRQGVCRSPGDDKLRSKYVSEDYKYACLACVKAREGNILCTRRFVKASKTEIGSSDSSTTSAMAASGIAHTLAVDLSRIRWASCAADHLRRGSFSKATKPTVRKRGRARASPATEITWETATTMTKKPPPTPPLIQTECGTTTKTTTTTTMATAMEDTWQSQGARQYRPRES